METPPGADATQSGSSGDEWALPESIVLAGDHLFGPSKHEEAIRKTVLGTTRFEIEESVVDQDGRGRIAIADRAQNQSVTLATDDWHFNAEGAMQSDQTLVVCYNRLVGRTSRWTEGIMPDPPGGVHLVCRASSDEGWGAEFRVAQREHAAWLLGVIAEQAGGFRVVYFADNGWLFDTSKAFPTKAEIYLDGELSAPTVVDRTISTAL